MSSNSNPQTNIAFKDLLLHKATIAVLCGVVSYLIYVFVYVTLMKFSVYPLEWISAVFNTVTSLSTWMHLIPFATLIFTQIMICSKDYISKGTYMKSRFSKFICIFSIRTFVLCTLYAAVGGLTVWLGQSLSDGRYGNLYVKCNEDEYCLVDGSLFLVLSGLWSGFCFFVNVHISERSIVFPVIQQSKLLHFKSHFLCILTNSRKMATYPIIGFIMFYLVFRSYLSTWFGDVFHLKVIDNPFDIQLCILAWIFSIMYFLNMNLTRFFFQLFLTQHIEYPTVSLVANDSPLTEALRMDKIPLIQHLACLDLYLLSIWSPERRQSLFTLSQPGGHPHTWNRLVQVCLKLICEFTTTLNKFMDISINDDKPVAVTKKEFTPKLVDILPPTPEVSPKYENIRSAILENSCESVSVVPVQSSNVIFSEVLQMIAAIIAQKLITLLEIILRIPIIKYLFGELPEIYIHECLSNGQLIVWIAQALSNIACASFTEDPYGIVQKDLPAIITTLLDVKRTSEKLQKVPAIFKKGDQSRDFSIAMNNNVQSAVKRSLFQLCITFNNYLNEIPLDNDAAVQLRNFQS